MNDPYSIFSDFFSLSHSLSPLHSCSLLPIPEFQLPLSFLSSLSLTFLASISLSLFLTFRPPSSPFQAQSPPSFSGSYIPELLPLLFLSLRLPLFFLSPVLPLFLSYSLVLTPSPLLFSADAHPLFFNSPFSLLVLLSSFFFLKLFFFRALPLSQTCSVFQTLASLLPSLLPLALLSLLLLSRTLSPSIFTSLTPLSRSHHLSCSLNFLLLLSLSLLFLLCLSLIDRRMLERSSINPQSIAGFPVYALFLALLLKRLDFPFPSHR